MPCAGGPLAPTQSGHLLLCRIERRPPKLDLAGYPYLPRARVEITPVSAYMSLLGAS